MFNIGFGELAIICIVLIIAVGPERLPSMMKTVGKTMRTLRQASRDLRESTGIDELLREDFDYRPPLRPAAPPVGPPPVAREAEPALPESAVTPEGAPSPDLASAASLPSDAPIEDGAPAPLPDASPATANLDHANVEGSLPSDAPLAAPEPGPAALGASELAARGAARPRES